MGRLVELEATGPRKLDKSDLDSEKGNIAICRCGLSEGFPFCDGSHRRTRTEESDVCYRYGAAEDRDDQARTRKRVDRVVYVDDAPERFEEPGE